jgi:arylsulfatase A-like enzyme
MRSKRANWLDSVWTLTTVGLCWGIVYATFEAFRVMGQSHTLEEASASLPLFLSFVVFCGLLFALFSLVIGLPVAAILQLGRSEPNHARLAGVYCGCVTGIYAFLVLPTWFDSWLTLLGSLMLAFSTGTAVSVVAGLWQNRALQRVIPMRVRLSLVWIGLLLLTVLFAFFEGNPRRVSSRRSPVNPEPVLGGRPNVVLLTIDAVRADHLGCYGYPHEMSPFIDALAEEGILYENAVSAAPWTYPSFASLFTSLYPTEVDIPGDARTIDDLMRGIRVDSMRTMMAEVYQQQGYQTQAVVTNNWLNRHMGFAQGFDGYIRVDALPTSLDRLGEASLVNLLQRFWPRFYSILRDRYEAVWGPAEDGWDADAAIVNHYVLNYLRGELREPFFLWVHYIDPHMPYDPPEELMPTIDGLSPERLRYLRSTLQEILDTTARIRPIDLEAMVALYDAEIQESDAAVGELVAELDRLGLRDRTVIVVLSDHGEEFLEHGRFGHGQSLYQELTRVPLIITGPEVLIGPPRIVTGVVSSIDVMPTLLALSGLPIPAEAEGRDLFAEEDKIGTQPVFSEGLIFGPERKMIQDGQYKLIIDPYTGGLELFDLRADPGETNSLVAAAPTMAESLLQGLLDWMAHAAEIRTALPHSEETIVDPGSTLWEELEEGGY